MIKSLQRKKEEATMNKQKQDLNIREALFRKGIVLDQKVAENIYTIKKIHGIKKKDLCCKIFINTPESCVIEEYQIGKQLYDAAPDLFIKTYELIHFTISNSVFVTETCDCYAMIMDLAISFNNLCIKKNLNTFKKLMSDICRCLMVLHTIGYCHFDVKPQNIVQLHNNHFSLIDFGISKKIDGTVNLSEQSGTLYYMAPETLRGEYSPQGDIFSLGMIVRFMLKGYEYDPSLHSSPNQLYILKEGLKPFISNDNIVQHFFDIINKATAFDRTDRYLTIQELYNALGDVVSSTKELHIKTVLPSRKELFGMHNKRIIIFSYYSASKSEYIASMIRDIISINKKNESIGFGRVIYGIDNTFQEVLNESKLLADRLFGCNDFVIIHFWDQTIPIDLINDEHIVHVSLNHSIRSKNCISANNFYERQLALSYIEKMIQR